MELSDSKVELARRQNKVVYRDGARVVKVFNAAKPAGDVFNEALNIARIGETGIRHPHVLEVSQVAGGSWALSTQYVEGRVLDEFFVESSGTPAFDGYLEQFVDLQVAVQGTPAPTLLNAQREKISHMIAVLEDLDPTIRYDLQMKADRMMPGRSVCHGDFNPTNVIVGSDGELYVCDWAHVTRGLPEADAAMTYILTADKSPQTAAAYLDLYAQKADVPKQKILYWVPVVAAAELSRGRKENEETLRAWVSAANDYE
jgi:aminoglycoside phosphotransferase (APT) family kinase protein